MGVVYEDRPILEGKDVKDAGKVFPRLANDGDTTAKLSVNARLMNPLMCGSDASWRNLSKISRKVSFYLSEYTSETSSSERVS